MANGCPVCPYTLFGAALCFLSVICFALGIADVVYSYCIYCLTDQFRSVCSSEALYPAWVGVGIWASIPIFITGLFGIIVMKAQPKKRNTLLALTAMSALLFSPAIVGVSAVEVWMGCQVFYNTPPSDTSVPLSSGRTGSDVTKLSLPLTNVVIGSVLFVLLMCAIVWECCEGIMPWSEWHGRHYQDMTNDIENGGQTFGSNSSTVYALDMPVLCSAPSRQSSTHFDRAICGVHGSDCRRMSYQLPCQECMERARRSNGNWPSFS